MTIFSLEKLDAYDPGIASGFLHTYRAMSNLRGTQIFRFFELFVEDLVGSKSTVLTLTECAGVDSKPTVKFDFMTIALALQFNTYFEYDHVILPDVVLISTLEA